MTQTQNSHLSTLQGARDRLLQTTHAQTATKRPQLGLSFLKVKFKSESNKKSKKDDPQETKKSSRLPFVFSDVNTSLKSHKDRKLDKELHDLTIRKRNREVEYFLSQRQFFIERVFTSNNELRFSRLKKQYGSTARVRSCPQFTPSPAAPDCSLSPTVTAVRIEGSPAVTPAVTPGVVRAATPTDSVRSKSTVRSRLNNSNKEKPSLPLRDLLFLEESQEPPTPNRQRILQARARMFPRRKVSMNHPAKVSPSPSKQEPDVLQLPTITPTGDQQSRHVRFRNNVQVHRPKSETLLKGEKGTDYEQPIEVRVKGCDLVDRAKKSAASNGDVTRLEDLEMSSEKEEMPRELSIHSPGRGVVIGTPKPSATAKVSWSDTLVDGKSIRMAEVRAQKNRMQARLAHAETSQQGDSIDLESQERLLQRIMLTIPPDVIAKSTAHAQNLSDLMGYTEKRESMLQNERRRSQSLDVADTRFVNLVKVLDK